MNSDYKRVPWFIVMAGIVILFGHYIDVFNMIMPATVGDDGLLAFLKLVPYYYSLDCSYSLFFMRFQKHHY